MLPPPGKPGHGGARREGRLREPSEEGRDLMADAADHKRRSRLGTAMVASLSRFMEVLRSGEPIERHFRVRDVRRSTGTVVDSRPDGGDPLSDPWLDSIGSEKIKGSEVGSVVASPRYSLQNRYQDSGWEDLGRYRFDSEDEAVQQAGLLSQDAIIYGMVRVVDRREGRVVATFAAGGGRCRSGA